MYFNTTVEIPKIKGRIFRRKRGGTTYVLYQYGTEYNQEKRYTIPLRAISRKNFHSLTGAPVLRSAPMSSSRKY